MLRLNENFTILSQSYLFTEVAKRVSQFINEHPDAKVIKMGIGDVTKPICPVAIDAMHKAVDDMASASTFHGYGPEQGYDFLRSKIVAFDYKDKGIEIAEDEIFISDGAKSDTGNIGDIFSIDNKVAVTDPVYPVYIDTNVMAGRAGRLLDNGKWSNIEYLSCNMENGFIPALPKDKVSIIYLCYPNNPTGTTLTKNQLKEWVDYAIKNNAIILFDSAYEIFITEDDVPHSIYEIEGADKCAIEFRSFSKTAGFTGLRCGYTVVPKSLKYLGADGNYYSLNQLWNRRQCTKFNGASYVTQRAAESLYTEEGQKQIKDTITYYLKNAQLLLDGCKEVGFEVVGGVNAPYVWIKAPNGLPSWDFFQKLLEELHIVGTPGVGFGPSGEGYLRLTAFNSYENTKEAVERIKNRYKNINL